MGLIAKIFPKRALAKARLQAITKPAITLPSFGSVVKPKLTMPAFDAQLFGSKYSPEAPPPETQSNLLSGLPDLNVSGRTSDISQSIKSIPKNNLWMIAGGFVIALIAFFALRKK